MKVDEVVITDLDGDLLEDNLHVGCEHTRSVRRRELRHYADVEARKDRLVIARTYTVHAS